MRLSLTPNALTGPGPPHVARALLPLSTTLLVLGVALGARWVWGMLYGPVIEGDAFTYLKVAERIATGRLHEDDGGRPPVYPLFLLMLGLRPLLVQAVQGLLGAATAWLVSVMVWRGTCSVRIATLAGVTQALLPDFLAFEAILVTESLACFQVTLAALLLCMLRERPTARRAVALSVVLSTAALNKTFLIFLIPLALIAMAWTLPAPAGPVRRAGGSLAVAFVVPALLLVGSWCAWQWRAYGEFGPSTMTGFRLSQHVGGRMELAPDRFATLRDIYLKHRLAVRAETGSHINTIWAAIPEMQRATGLSYARTAQEVQTMSVVVLRADPGYYLRSVAKGWAYSWSRPMYLKEAYVHSSAALPLLRAVTRSARLFELSLNAAFLACSLALLFPGLRRRVDPAAQLPLLACLVVAGTLVAAIGEISDNGKFALPFLPIALVVVAVYGGASWNARRSR